MYKIKVEDKESQSSNWVRPGDYFAETLAEAEALAQQLRWRQYVVEISEVINKD